MAIPASEIVSITPRVLKGGGSELVLDSDCMPQPRS